MRRSIVSPPPLTHMQPERNSKQCWVICWGFYTEQTQPSNKSITIDRLGCGRPGSRAFKALAATLCCIHAVSVKTFLCCCHVLLLKNFERFYDGLNVTRNIILMTFCIVWNVTWAGKWLSDTFLEIFLFCFNVFYMCDFTPVGPVLRYGNANRWMCDARVSTHIQIYTAPFMPKIVRTNLKRWHRMTRR